MLYSNDRDFVCGTDSAFGDITDGTRFYFKKYGEIIRARFAGGNILYEELIGMVNQSGLVKTIFTIVIAIHKFIAVHAHSNLKKFIIKDTNYIDCGTYPVM